MRFILDNSVVMEWCFGAEDQEYSDHILDLLDQGEALVPGSWPFEVTNGLLVAGRRRQIGQGEADQFLRLLTALPIRVIPENPDRILDSIRRLAREHRLSSFEASYLDLALREGLPLATRSEELRYAAEKLDVERVLPPI